MASWTLDHVVSSMKFNWDFDTKTVPVLRNLVVIFNGFIVDRVCDIRDNRPVEQRLYLASTAKRPAGDRVTETQMLLLPVI